MASNFYVAHALWIKNPVITGYNQFYSCKLWMFGTSKKVEEISRCFFLFSETSVRGALKVLLYSWSRNFENGCNVRLMNKGCIKSFRSIIDY
jgi:hypothetical protein